METEMYDFSPEDEPKGKRWDPLGAPNEECDNLPDRIGYLCKHDNDIDKVRNLEKEQELLNTSLFALTTHFAQVQFRLRQVVHAPAEAKEKLLKSLEEFAFRGIPDIGLVREQIDEAGLVNVVKFKQNQYELFNLLKGQLKELEEYAFDKEDGDIPQDVLLERQRVILTELKTRMNLDLDEQKFHLLTPADVSKKINYAVDQLITPLQLKEHLVQQLKTQVADLERFINYLQDNPRKHKECSCSDKGSLKQPFEKESTLNLIHKLATVLHIFAAVQLGCGFNEFKKNELKRTMKINHWGDMRAKLELAVAKIKEIVRYQNRMEIRRSSIDSEDSFDIHLTAVVRKHLATSIRDLIQHGTCSATSSSLVPLAGCFLPRSSSVDTDVHAWNIILKYYYMKNGETYNSTPARKLSQSFNLDIVGSTPSSNKQNLLCCIGNIISTHNPYKRSSDSHFKAFICAALNSSKLVPWLNLIFTCKPLIKESYMPWSYVAKTGFQDSLRSLDMLSPFKFNLPVDLAVKQFQNIKDVFT